MLNPARIAKNTVILYIRMIFVLAANFLAVRVLLEVLGVEDYGLFNLIVGFVTLFTFLNGAMLSTVQRFLCFELGKCDSGRKPSTSASQTRLIFTLCFWLFVALALLIVLVSETGGLWFVHHKLNIPSARFHSAQVVYQLSIVVMVFKTMQIPYTALIVSYERMNAFAKISIVEAVLTLAAALAIKWTPGDLLVVYAALYAIAQTLVFATYALYCRRHFAEGRLIRLNMRPSILNPQLSTLDLLKSLSGFFSWSILGAVANMLKQQGLNVLLNVFFGVAFNATWAVANRVGAAVNQLIVNFQQAFNPQIVKTWAAEDKRPFFDLLVASSKFSFLLMWLFALPLMAGCEFFLGLWLKGELPPQLVVFVNLTVVYLLFDALSGPLWMAVQATGKIAAYQVQVSMLISSAFVLSWAAFLLGAPAKVVVVVNAVVNALCLFYRIVFLHRHISFPAVAYFKQALLPVVIVALSGGGVAYVLRAYCCDFLPVPISVALVGLSGTGAITLFGLSVVERRFVLDRVVALARRRS